MMFGARDRVAAEIVGIVSDDAAITGHAVHGVRVVGTFHELPALVVRLRIAVIYLVEPVEDSALADLRRELKGSGVRIVRWGAGWFIRHPSVGRACGAAIAVSP